MSRITAVHIRTQNNLFNNLYLFNVYVDAITFHSYALILYMYIR